MTKASLLSAYLMAARPNDLFIHILDCEIPDDTWSAWEKGVRAIAPRINLVRHRVRMEQFQNFKKWHGSLGAYARLDLPQLLPDVAWCVYADGDTLFYDDPFKLQVFFDDAYPLAGHSDPPFSTHSWFTQWAQEGIDKTYVCSGFILMNLNWFRKHNATECCLRHIHDHPETRSPDQDALNALCEGKTYALPNE